MISREGLLVGYNLILIWFYVLTLTPLPDTEGKLTGWAINSKSVQRAYRRKGWMKGVNKIMI